jgi:hypothetical protein
MLWNCGDESEDCCVVEIVLQTSRLETSPRGDSSRIVRFTGSAREHEPVERGIESKLELVEGNHVLRRKPAGSRFFMAMYIFSIIMPA